MPVRFSGCLVVERDANEIKLDDLPQFTRKCGEQFLWVPKRADGLRDAKECLVAIRERRLRLRLHATAPGAGKHFNSIRAVTVVRRSTPRRVTGRRLPQMRIVVQPNLSAATERSATPVSTERRVCC